MEFFHNVNINWMGKTKYFVSLSLILLAIGWFSVLRHHGLDFAVVIVFKRLLELARTERSDLIVLSAHGSTCNPAMTSGSVTAHLLTHSVVPLLVLQDLRDSGPRGPEGDRRAPPPRSSSFPEGI